MPAFIRPLTLPFTVLDTPHYIVDPHPFDGDDLEMMADKLHTDLTRPRFRRDGSTYFLTVAELANEYTVRAVECIEFPDVDWTPTVAQVWHDCMMCRANYLLNWLGLA
jgi:hypothetical protein